MNDKYKEQVKLLVKCLPVISQEDCFALKGGTAINLFYRNLPRLSVDIDLAYILNDSRADAIKKTNEALTRISGSLRKLNIQNVLQENDEIKKIICFTDKAKVKIEPNYTNRGTAYPAQKMMVCPEVQDMFGFAEINVLSKPELFGGKICAALDRQHPRDLFDVSLMLENNEITEDVKNGFLIELLSHNRNITELLNPNQKNMSEIFETQFKDMTDYSFSYEDHVKTFQILVKKMNALLTEKDKQFLIDFISLKECHVSSDFPNIKNLSAIQWKVFNIKKLKDTNPKKFDEQIISTAEYFENKKGRERDLGYSR